MPLHSFFVRYLFFYFFLLKKTACKINYMMLSAAKECAYMIKQNNLLDVSQSCLQVVVLEVQWLGHLFEFIELWQNCDSYEFCDMQSLLFNNKDKILQQSNQVLHTLSFCQRNSSQFTWHSHVINDLFIRSQLIYFHYAP